jgi:chromosome segregation ATPase
MADRQARIDLAQEAYDEGYKQYVDANNELELYKEILKELDPEADKEVYDATQDDVRMVQMQIADLEKAYDMVRDELESLNREEKRLEDEVADYHTQLEIRGQTAAAQQTMEEAKESAENTQAEIDDLAGRLTSTKDAGVKAEITAKIADLEGELDDLKEVYDAAQQAFNELAKQTMALEAAKVAREDVYYKQQAFADAEREVERVGKQIADLEGRLADFAGFETDTSDRWRLPACGPDMYLDEWMVPQKVQDTTMELSADQQYMQEQQDA